MRLMYINPGMAQYGNGSAYIKTSRRKLLFAVYGACDHYHDKQMFTENIVIKFRCKVFAISLEVHAGEVCGL